MQFIKATSGHIDAIAAIYGRIIDAQETGGKKPTVKTGGDLRASKGK